VRAWIDQYGMPTDLLPYSAHDVGQGFSQSNAKIVTRYHCCFVNLMWPVWNRAKEDGNTLFIRGTKIADATRLPAYSGEIHEGVELWYPIQDWSHSQVQTYLELAGAPRNRVYDHMTNAPECARCTAWWGEGRAAYLKRYHPALFADYMAGLRVVAGEITESVVNLRRELAEGG
jgi:phosphoadenosine phosphosulfate reductase